MQPIAQAHETVSRIQDAVNKALLGQNKAVEQVVCCLLAGGHVLLEGAPGLGKTLLAKALSRLVDARYRRIQLTPDLLPSDIVGTLVFNAKTGSFQFHKGPIFTEILLADEINRTPPKSQAALLEGMEERQVTIGGSRHQLPELFFVIATQNPIEYEGTYPLPEAQLDRFMMKVTLDYPPREAELSVIRAYASGAELRDVDSIISGPIVSKEEILQLREAIVNVTVREEVLDYVMRICAETRDPAYVLLGASSRAAVEVFKAARSLAAMRGMDFVSPDEVKEVILPALRHRVILRPEALIDGLTADMFLENTLRQVTVPR